MKSAWNVASTIFNGGLNAGKKLNVLVKGTNFQVKGLGSASQTPDGFVALPTRILHAINNPGTCTSGRIGSRFNHIAYLIPCHRVIRKDGILGECRWNLPIKKSMIGWEMAKAS